LEVKLYTLIFEADTPAGKLFDVALIWAILLSVLVVMADSVQNLRQGLGHPHHRLDNVISKDNTNVAAIVSVRPTRNASLKQLHYCLSLNTTLPRRGASEL